MVEERIGKMEDNTQEINQNKGERQRYSNCERIIYEKQDRMRHLINI